MKFDVVLGNPPYQAPKIRTIGKPLGSCGSRLWHKFVELSFDICKDDGYISLIHPSLWRKPENKLYPLFKENNLIYLDINDINTGRKTFGVSTRYDWYVVQKSNYSGKTKINDEDGNKIEMDISGYPFIPNCNFDLINSLLAKKDEKKCQVLYSRSMYGADKKNMRSEQDDVFKHPCVYMITKSSGLSLWYADADKGHFGVPKVIISENGGFLGTCVDADGSYGLTQFMFALVIENKQEGENIQKAIIFEEFKKVWKAIQWMSNHREWRIFKYFKKDFWKEFDL
ncbi:MAG: Eco57I restriction-modification methylase domain-containing protein [Phenylobacterium sp.]